MNYDFNTHTLSEMGYTFETCMFHDSTCLYIEHTFIITMHDSSRMDNMWKQIHEHKPTKFVTIMYNRGYKHTNKPNVDTSAKDLWHANSTIMKLYKEDAPILILEDDCEFLYTFRQHARRIETFILQHPNLGAYNLGGLPLLSYPVSCQDLRGLLFGFAHAVIYTKHGRTQLQNNSIRILHDLECSMTIKMYFPALPLAVQKIEQTENSKNWDLGGFSFCYLNLFGSKLFHVHHILGWFGGLASVVIFTITCTVLIIVFFCM